MLSAICAAQVAPKLSTSVQIASWFNSKESEIFYLRKKFVIILIHHNKW